MPAGPFVLARRRDDRVWSGTRRVCRSARASAHQRCFRRTVSASPAPQPLRTSPRRPAVGRSCGGPHTPVPRCGTRARGSAGCCSAAPTAGEAWASVEDSILVVGPPRSGKGLHLIIPAILDAPGAVITTSTRPDNLAVTLHARRRIGPVAVFDPQQLAAGLPAGLRWSPIRGCDVPQTAMIRARGLAAGTGMSRTVDGGDFWQAQTEMALRCLLHAAALGERTPADLYRWSLDPVAAIDAITLLGRADAAEGWEDALDQAVHADPRTRDSIWLGVRQALGALADPRVLRGRQPGAGSSLRPGDVPARQRHPVPARHRERRRCRRRARRRPGRGHGRDRPPALRRIAGQPARPAAAAGVGRDRQPRAAAVAAVADVRGRRHRHHHPRRPAVAVAGAGPVGRVPGRTRSGTPPSSRSSSAAAATPATSPTCPR